MVKRRVKDTDFLIFDSDFAEFVCALFSRCNIYVSALIFLLQMILFYTFKHRINRDIKEKEKKKRESEEKKEGKDKKKESLQSLFLRSF